MKINLIDMDLKCINLGVFGPSNLDEIQGELLFPRTFAYFSIKYDEKKLACFSLVRDGKLFLFSRSSAVFKLSCSHC